MKTFKQFIEEANQISPITGKGWMVIPPVRVKDTMGMKRHIVPDFGNPNYKPPQKPQASKKYNNDVAQGNALTPQVAQLVPMKSTVLGPDLQSLSHVDTRGPGEKLKSVMRQKAYMDDTGRRPPKIP